jgi:hypothetical protein
MAKSWDFASADSSATAIGARRSHKSRFAFHPCHLVVSASFPRRRCVVNAAIESAPQLADCGPNPNRLIAAVRTLRRDALRCAAHTTLRYGARVQIRTHKLELLDNNLRQEARKSIFELAGEPVRWRTAAGLRMH